MAVGVVVGLVLPGLAALLHPLLVPTLLIPLTLALVRLDWAALARASRDGRRVLLLLGWLLLGTPGLMRLVASALGTAGVPLALQKALVLMAASSPIISSVAIALMVGLDAGLALVAVLAATALVPLTLPVVATVLLGVSLDIAPLEFFARLVAMVGGAFAVAALVRRLVPRAAAPSAAETLDGITVLNLVVFAIAIMDGVTRFVLARPGYAVLAVLLAFAANLLLQWTGTLLFRGWGPRAAATVGLLSGNCNMGLVLVALQGRESFDVTVFFALAQLPMYMLPALLAPAYRRASRAAR